MSSRQKLLLFTGILLLLTFPFYVSAATHVTGDIKADTVWGQSFCRYRDLQGPYHRDGWSERGGAFLALRNSDFGHSAFFLGTVSIPAIPNVWEVK